MSGPRGIEERVRTLSGHRVVVLGDVMLDRFVWGDVRRISPEAPVPVVRVRRESDRLGGAANVAANIAALGGCATVVGLVGDDAAGRRIGETLEALGVRASLEVDSDRSTTVKSRVIARAQQVVRVDRESDHEPSASIRAAIARRAVEAVLEADALVVSDYEKGAIHPDTVRPVLDAAAAHGRPVVVDPKLVHFDAYQPITVLKPNEAEAGRVTATRIEGDESCLRAARSILERLDTSAVLVTRGSAGMLLVERDAPPEFIAAVAREVYDVTGAGDTVVAVLALALGSGAPLREGARLANLAGAIVVGKIGTATVTVEELSSRIRGSGRGG